MAPNRKPSLPLKWSKYWDKLTSTHSLRMKKLETEHERQVHKLNQCYAMTVRKMEQEHQQMLHGIEQQYHKESHPWEYDQDDDSVDNECDG